EVDRELAIERHRHRSRSAVVRELRDARELTGAAAVHDHDDRPHPGRGHDLVVAGARQRQPVGRYARCRTEVEAAPSVRAQRLPIPAVEALEAVISDKHILRRGDIGEQGVDRGAGALKVGGGDDVALEYDPSGSRYRIPSEAAAVEGVAGDDGIARL